MAIYALIGLGGSGSDFGQMIRPFFFVVLAAALGSVILLAWAMVGRR